MEREIWIEKERKEKKKKYKKKQASKLCLMEYLRFPLELILQTLYGARGIAQQLRTQTAFPKDWCSNPRTAHNFLRLDLQVIHTPFLPVRESTCMSALTLARMHTRARTHTHKHTNIQVILNLENTFAYSSLYYISRRKREESLRLKKKKDTRYDFTNSTLIYVNK